LTYEFFYKNNKKGQRPRLKCVKEVWIIANCIFADIVDEIENPLKISLAIKLEIYPNLRLIE